VEIVDNSIFLTVLAGHKFCNPFGLNTWY